MYSESRGVKLGVWVGFRSGQCGSGHCGSGHRGWQAVDFRVGLGRVMFESGWERVEMVAGAGRVWVRSTLGRVSIGSTLIRLG